MSLTSQEHNLVHLTWSTFGRPGDSSSWEVLIQNIKELEQETFRAFLSCMAFIVCHFNHEAIDTFLADLANGRIPVVERLRDAAAVAGRENRAITKISLVRAVLESVGGPLNVYQRNFNKSMSCNDNLRILNPVPKDGLRSNVSFGSLDEQRLMHLLKAIRPRGFIDSPQGARQYIDSQKKEIVLHIPIGLPESVAKGVSTDLIYNLSLKMVDWFRIEMHRHKLITAANPDNAILVLICCCSSSCLNRCNTNRGHTYDCERLTLWLKSEQGRHLYRYNSCRVKEGQSVEQFDFMISAMVWYHRMQIHSEGTEKAARKSSFIESRYFTSTCSLVQFDRLLSGQPLENAHEIWEGMAIAFDKVYGTTLRGAAIHAVTARGLSIVKKEEDGDDMEQCQEYWRLRQTLKHQDALESMLSRMAQ